MVDDCHTEISGHVHSNSICPMAYNLGSLINDKVYIMDEKCKLSFKTNIMFTNHSLVIPSIKKKTK